MRDLDKYLVRARRLQEIADQDDIFLLWKEVYKTHEKNFVRFTKWMPKGVRKMLWGYAEGGRLMYQRLYSIACENMDFTGENICLWAEEEEKKGNK